MLTVKATRDYQLILKAKNGDQRAFEQLMNLYSKSIFFEIHKLVRNEETANDLMMESMAKAFEQLSQYQPKFAFSTWLKRVSINHTIDSLRKGKLTTVSMDGSVNAYGEPVGFEVTSDMPTPAEQLIQNERSEAVREYVSGLKEMYRELITLRYFKEMSYAEIATETSLPEGTVKARLHRAKGLLQDMMVDSQFAMTH
ncbi:MAG: RNA polymerase sigma factor (sigma-70 family) [Salibacteraceae bacterium]|jgi:RNA polymerase sigma-70 factor (ECF subfamily)